MHNCSTISDHHSLQPVHEIASALQLVDATVPHMPLRLITKTHALAASTHCTYCNLSPTSALPKPSWLCLFILWLSLIPRFSDSSPLRLRWGNPCALSLSSNANLTSCLPLRGCELCSGNLTTDRPSLKVPAEVILLAVKEVPTTAPADRNTAMETAHLETPPNTRSGLPRTSERNAHPPNPCFWGCGS